MSIERKRGRREKKGKKNASYDLEKLISLTEHFIHIFLISSSF
jgi:hypothetical protein